MVWSCLLFCAGSLWAQDISIELGPDEVGMNEMFTITVTVSNGSIKNYTDFPTIEGFAKRGTSSSSKTNIVNGQISSSQSIRQSYMPLEEGTQGSAVHNQLIQIERVPFGTS